MRALRFVLAAGAAGALALPAAASAATKTVYLGPPPGKTTAKLQKLGDDPTAFFSRTTTIHRGDKVKFVNESFHNVDLPKKGTAPLPLVGPAGTASGYKDEAGVPFWFNGQPVFGFNPTLLADSTSTTFDGTARVHSALPPVRKTNKFTVKFAKAGSWTFYCDIHPGMKGRVVVRKASKKIPGKKADAKTLHRQLVRTLASTKKAIKKPSPKNTFTLGRASSYGSEVLAIFPKSRTVKVGTVVKFEMPATSREIHTASFGTDPTVKGNYLQPLADSFGAAPFIDPRASYPSDTGLVSFTSATHGNTFWNSGILDSNKKSPFPRSNRIRFDEKGTFVFWCLIHTNMTAKVVVK